VNIVVDDQNGNPVDYMPSSMWVYFNFAPGSNLSSLESTLTQFQYNWNSPGANQLAVDLPVSLGSDPVLDFDFSGYSGLEVTGLAAVPEPASLSILLLGAPVLLSRRRRYYLPPAS
jgi:hypothetical protein